MDEIMTNKQNIEFYKLASFEQTFAIKIPSQNWIKKIIIDKLNNKRRIF